MTPARTLVAALLLLGAAPLARAAALPLGKTFAGASCAWSAPAARLRPFACDNGAEHGSLATLPLAAPLPQDPAARTVAIEDAARREAGGMLAKATHGDCGGGNPLDAGDDSLLFFCTLRASGEAHLVLVRVVGNVLYKAEGSVAMLPVLEAAIANTAGRPYTAAATEAALRLVESRYPAAVARAGGVDIASDEALIELGRLDAAQRDYAGAEAAYRRALAIETRLFGADAAPVGEILLELALQVSNEGRFDEAAALFRRAEPIIDATGDIELRARLASYEALDAANQRHFAKALKFARAATAMRRQALATAATRGGSPLTGSRGELAHSLRIEAMMALKLGDLATALADATEVLQIIDSEPSLPLWWRPEAVSMMAEIDEARQRVVPAERQFRDAVAMEKKLFGDTAPTALSEMRLGTFYADQQVYSAAVAAYRPALDILARDPVARAAIGADEIVPFLAAAAVLAGRNQQPRAGLDADAFRASQLIGSTVTGRTIARAAARLAAGNPALADMLAKAQAAERRRDELRLELAAETAKPDDQRNAAYERGLAADLAAASTRATVLAAAVQNAFPAYHHFADPGPVGLETLQHSLHAHEAFLSFVVGTNRTFALVATPTDLDIAPLPLTAAALSSDVGELRRAFVPRLGRVAPFDLEAAYELYRNLLLPLAPALAGVDHLIVAPSGALASLPFAILVTAPPANPNGHDYVDAAWLVRRMALSEVPSARAFLTLRDTDAHRRPAPRPLLAIADPTFVGAKADALDALDARCRQGGPIDAALLRALPPLPETADEVQKVAAKLGASPNSLLLGPAATEADLRTRPLDQYRVLYFATHALLPHELHCQTQPALVLSPPAVAARSTDTDGLLEASEIAALKLNADLVVLSACNTAAEGGAFGGEALSGLADAFFNAGARAVLASHWEVPSHATVRLMTGFFTDLKRAGGRGLAAALRRSELALIADPATAHPFYWAAFTLIGDGAQAVEMAASPRSGQGGERGRT